MFHLAPKHCTALLEGLRHFSLFLAAAGCPSGAETIPCRARDQLPGSARHKEIPKALYGLRDFLYKFSVPTAQNPAAERQGFLLAVSCQQDGRLRQTVGQKLEHTLSQLRVETLEGLVQN